MRFAHFDLGPKAPARKVRFPRGQPLPEHLRRGFVWRMSLALCSPSFGRRSDWHCRAVLLALLLFGVQRIEIDQT